MLSRIQPLGLCLLCLLALGCGDDPPDEGFTYRGSDLCSSPTDTALVEMHVPVFVDGGIVDSGLQHPDVIVRDCAVGPCQEETFSGEGLDACVETCLDTTTLAGLSSDCVGCFVDTTNCALEFCVTQCLTGTGAACIECFDANCGEGQNDCTGIDLL